MAEAAPQHQQLHQPLQPPLQQPLLAGFDAGQTHTTCRLALLTAPGSWTPLAEGEGSGVSHLAAPAGEQRFKTALRSSFTAALAAAGLPGHQPLAAAAVGASGIEAGTAVQQRGLALTAETLGLKQPQADVCGDEHTALLGAFGEQPGVLVISGTGCIALGRDASGRTHRCGGWGWLLDGAGSAMDIGRDGLALSVQMADGRLSETPLRAALWQALAAETPQQVKAAVVADGFAPAGFARLAPLLDAAAAAGDPQARAVIERSAEALAQMVAGVSLSLGLAQPAVCGVGGALEHLGTLQGSFARAVERHCPGAQLQAAAGDACAGALSLAAQAALRC
jgi:N-acetylglucosamine kinase-like BadF-type ATPase